MSGESRLLVIMSNDSSESMGAGRFMFLMVLGILPRIDASDLAVGPPGSIPPTSRLHEARKRSSRFRVTIPIVGWDDRIDRPSHREGLPSRSLRLCRKRSRHLRRRGVLTLPTHLTGRSHRLKDARFPPIFRRRPIGRRHKIGSPCAAKRPLSRSVTRCSTCQSEISVIDDERRSQ